MLTFLVGAFIGLVLGLTGAGGSVLALPLLVTLLHFEPASAAGLALGAVALAAATGVFLRRGKHQVVWGVALVLGGSGALLAPLGQWLAALLPERVLMLLFAGLVLLIALRMWRQAAHAPEETRVLRANAEGVVPEGEPVCRLSPTGRFEWRWPCVLRISFVGALTGVLSGLFGVGGGFIIVPALVLLMGLSMVQAVATSLAVITAVSMTGFASFVWHEQGFPSGILFLLPGALAGMLSGTVLAPKLAGPLLQKFFVIVMLLMSLMMLGKFFMV